MSAMQMAMVGLGRMGGNIVRRLMADGHDCVVYDRDAAAVDGLAREGAVPASSLRDMVDKLAVPRAVWLMVPAGAITEGAVQEVGAMLDPGDVLIDGGNSFFKDDVRRARMLAERGVRYVDVGTSGGVWGRERGYCLMIGGDDAAVDRLDPIFATLAPGEGDIPPTPAREGRPHARTHPERGYLHCGPSGAGHFVKMVHNGIEYGLMQAYAEGFDIMRGAAQAGLPGDQRFDLPLADIAEVWRRGSVISSWLLDLSADALARDEALDAFTGRVEDSGEGRWTVQVAVEEAVSAEVLTAALFARFRSRQDNTYGEKMLSAMRHGFGGHVEAEVAAGGRAA